MEMGSEKAGRLELEREIDELKRERGATILVHNYQPPEIQAIADMLGDSFDLSRRAAATDSDVIVFCGVHFMAEGAAILAPDKTVLLPREDAGCPMANMATAPALRDMKRRHPRAAVVCYVNSSAEVKAESDICCTSANAVRVVESVDADELLFVPDRNLALYVQRFTSKRIIPWNGYCVVHHRLKAEDIIAAKEAHPEAVVIVHPECTPDVIDLADEVLSTSGMIRFAAETPARQIIVGTEEGLLQRVQRENPDKEFFLPSDCLLCVNMKKTGLEDVAASLREMQPVISVPEEIASKARRALERMLAVPRNI